MQPVYIVALALLAILAGLLAARLQRQTRQAVTTAAEANEQAHQAETDIGSLRMAKFDMERRLAVEEQKAARIPEFEKALTAAAGRIEQSRLARIAAESQAAVAQEAVSRLEVGLADAKKRLAEALALNEQAAAELRQRLAAAETARDQAAARLDQAIQAKAGIEATLARAAAQIQERTQRAEALAGELQQARAEGAAARGESGERQARLAALQAALDQERKHGAEKLALIAGERQQMTQEFRSLAEEAIRRQSESAGQQSKIQIEGILTPLRERLADFQRGLLSAHDESVKERLALAEQIRQLSDNSAQVASETQQMAALLKGKAEGLGAWGEVLLSSILERSGLRAGEDYVFRESYSPDGSQRLRPDVVINLPGDQRVIIDSKVPLAAFEAYVNAGDDGESAAQLANHAAAMAGHIAALAGRGMPAAAESKRDYTVMFVPVEGALAAALRQDPNLTGLAVENQIALATPGTLMMALRSIANVWQAERRNRRAEAIAERAGKLYDSFAGYLGDMELLGDHLVRARHAYEEALGKLSSGRDNLIGQVEELREMGAKSTKELPRISPGERRFEAAETLGREPPAAPAAANEDTIVGT